MTQTEKIVIRWLAAVSAALTAMMGVIVAYPGNLIPQAFLLVGLAVSTFLATLVAFMAKTESGPDTASVGK